MISVVIPTLNEAARIQACVQALLGLGAGELMVVDGGSRDGTPKLAERAGARVLSAPRGRATQMNAGARQAKGSVLWFVHADCQPPRHAIDCIEKSLSDPRVVAGAFRTWTFDDVGHRLAPWLHLADFRSRYSRLPYGDQAVFVRRDAFWQVGGYPEQPLMEDLELALRLRRLGSIRIVPDRVKVSGRRFLAHPLRDTLLVNTFPLLYRLGVSPLQLARIYRNVR